MPRPGLFAIVSQQTGTALPMAMLILALLASLTMAFLAMSATEPLIAGNLKTGDQALALAEAGIDRARWALNNPAAPSSGLTNPLPAPVPAPYADQLAALGAGAYQVAVTDCSSGLPNPPGPPPLCLAPFSANDRLVIATGTVLRNGAALPGAPPIPQADIAAQRVVQVRLQAPTFPGMNPPGALNVGGSVQMSGNTSVVGSTPDNPSTCGDKTGVTYTDTAAATGQPNQAPELNGNASLSGTPPQSEITNSEFAKKALLSPLDLATLKALAQAQGTYIKPTSSSVDLTLSNGLTFVDTIDGQALSDPFNPSTDASKLPSVSVAGTNSGSGWLIVMGGLHMSGQSSYTGFIFALNDFQASGQTTITGAIVSQNVVDTVATVIDTQTTGNSAIQYNCSAVTTGGGYLPPSFGSVTYSLKPGTWKTCPSVGAC